MHRRFVNQLPDDVERACAEYVRRVEARGGRYEPKHLPKGHKKIVKKLRKITTIIAKIRCARSTSSTLRHIANLIDAMDSLPDVPLVGPTDYTTLQAWKNRSKFNTEMLAHPSIPSRHANLGLGRTSKQVEKKRYLDVPSWDAMSILADWTEGSVSSQLHYAGSCVALVIMKLQTDWEAYHNPDPRILGRGTGYLSPTHIPKRRDPRLIELAIAMVRNGSVVSYEAVVRTIKSTCNRVECFDHLNTTTLKDTVKYVRSWNKLGEPYPEGTTISTSLVPRPD
ncbi:MAG: hypothetical protein GY835_01480 [bacterium]|nr:hypothetical protein [bacterium]